MDWLRAGMCPLTLLLLFRISGQTAAPATAPVQASVAPLSPSTPLPDPKTLLAAVELNEKRLEALQRDYTYHVHTEKQELDKHGAVTKTETEEAESLTVDGVRVDRVVSRNGKALTPEEQQKENERIDKEVARAKEHRAKVNAKGGETNAHGDDVLPLSRILELGSFSSPRRELRDGRPTIVLDYAGNAAAKTHSAMEGIMRDVVGTVWIDEADEVLTSAQGRFLNDFKLGAGILADVRKGTNFSLTMTHVADGVWLPANISGQGTVRVLLFANFSGRMRVTTSAYKRFRASATIVGSHGAISDEGVPLPDQPAPSAPAPPR